MDFRLIAAIVRLPRGSLELVVLYEYYMSVGLGIDSNRGCDYCSSVVMFLSSSSTLWQVALSQTNEVHHVALAKSRAKTRQTLHAQSTTDKHQSKAWTCVYTCRSSRVRELYPLSI